MQTENSHDFECATQYSFHGASSSRSEPRVTTVASDVRRGSLRTQGCVIIYGSARRAVGKNIIVCSDGTGNSATKGRGTNVFKLFEAVDLNGHRTDPSLVPQIAFYDDGVGTDGILPLRLLGGAMGLGLARNVRQLYRQLARVYDPGDRIFLFGFSRGAFTVRTLAGMITTCGLVNGTKLASTHDLRHAVSGAYRAYRAGYDSLLTGLVGRLVRRPDRPTATARLRTKYPVHDPVTLAFIGVWDTVDAVGMPFAIGEVFNRAIYQFKFPTQLLSDRVERACQALSIDDDRKSFEPVLWDESNEPDGPAARIEQVWFAGAHSNVGGGYPKQGMSLVALDWMLRHAADSGLRLQGIDLEIIRGHATVDDKLYDPRAGFGLFYRWAPRDIAAYCRARGVSPKIHLTVAERIAHGTDDYAPGNLPVDARVVITRTRSTDRDAAADAAALKRAGSVEGVLRRSLEQRGSLLGDVKAWIVIGSVSYWFFMIAWVLLLSGAVAYMTDAERASVTVARVIEKLWILGKAVLGMDLSTLWGAVRGMARAPMRVALFGAVAGFAIAWALGRLADRRMTDRFSKFWQTVQQELRSALKQART